MAKKTEELASEIRKHVESGNVVFGHRETLKLLKKGELQKVYISSNCEKNSAGDVLHYGKLSNTDVLETQYPNDEFGVLCKRQHAVSVIGVKKG